MVIAASRKAFSMEKRRALPMRRSSRAFGIQARSEKRSDDSAKSSRRTSGLGSSRMASLFLATSRRTRFTASGSVP
jgi:hypothetical protein